MTNLEVDPNDIYLKFQELYPVEFKHAVAETKANLLAAKLAELQGDTTDEQ